MILDFTQHSEPEIKFAQRYADGALEVDDESVEKIGAIEVSGVARRNAEMARIVGHLGTTLEMVCSRCLQKVESRIDNKFEAEFVTLENYQQTDAERELHEGDFSLSIYDGERIDLDETVREQIILNLPMQQLCRENCAGLCAVCRKNKNENVCSCETKEIDPRWNALNQLINRN